MILGIVGAFIGGSFYTFLTTGTLALTTVSFNLGGLLVAIVGAIVAIFLWELINRRTA
jgi:uncharacterized membrane protein YeaQ/YmgE (transglycosylase-associated protein family)